MCDNALYYALNKNWVTWSDVAGKKMFCTYLSKPCGHLHCYYFVHQLLVRDWTEWTEIGASEVDCPTLEGKLSSVG